MNFQRTVFVLVVLLTSLVAAADAERIVVERQGVFHTPSPGAESTRIEIPMSAGLHFRKIVLDVDVTHKGWHARNDKKTNHAIFWLNRGDKWRSNVFGYVNVFGPTRPRVKLAHNVQQPAGKMLAQTAVLKTESGSTYHFRYVYNTTNGKVELTVSHAGKVVGRVEGNSVGQKIESDPHNNDSKPGFFLVFGHPADSPGPEVPTYDWKYSNLRVAFE
jgi:hypothetical protein